MVYRRSTKIISLVLSVIMLFALSSVLCFERAYAETDGEWEYTVTPQGVDITGFIGTQAQIVVPSKVGGKNVYSISGLCSNSYSKTTVKSITVSSGIKVLNSAVFKDYIALERITLPESLTSIGDNAFSGCTALSAITLPSAVSSIGENAFENCTALLSANLTCQAAAVPNRLFAKCAKLSTVTLPPYSTSVGDFAFSGCALLKTVYIPDSVKTIGMDAFSGCNMLETVNLPAELKTIGQQAFKDCWNLKSAFIPNKVKSVGNDMFRGCIALKEVYISSSVTSIGDDVFAGCSNIETIVFGGNYINCAKAFDVNASPKVYYPEKYASEWQSFTSAPKEAYNGAASVVISGTLSAAAGNKANLKIGISPSNASFADVYTITSSNTSVATVAQDGTVTAKAPGSTTITITCVNGTTGTAKFTVKPKAPSGLTAATKSTSSIELKWDDSGATGYYIYRAASKNGKYKKIDSVIEPSYTNKGLTKGKTYYYKVVGYTGSGDDAVTSDYSKVVSAKATSPAPSTVSASKTKSGVATIKWSKSTGASGYEVYMAKSKSGKYSKIATVTSGSTLSYKKTGLTAKKTYYFKVRSYVTVSGKKVYSPYTKVVKVKV